MTEHPPHYIDRLDAERAGCTPFEIIVVEHKNDGKGWRTIAGDLGRPLSTIRSAWDRANRKTRGGIPREKTDERHLVHLDTDQLRGIPAVGGAPGVIRGTKPGDDAGLLVSGNAYIDRRERHAHQERVRRQGSSE